jgi:hypothetical protein
MPVQTEYLRRSGVVKFEDTLAWIMDVPDTDEAVEGTRGEHVFASRGRGSDLLQSVRGRVGPTNPSGTTALPTFAATHSEHTQFPGPPHGIHYVK